MSMSRKMPGSESKVPQYRHRSRPVEKREKYAWPGLVLTTLTDNVKDAQQDSLVQHM